jgi:cytochrome b subunit of formate dehydrogenase
MAIRFQYRAWGMVLLLLCLCSIAGPPPLNAQADCSSCHDQGPKLQKSAHAALSCDTCHSDHDKFPHPADVPKPECATCHVDQAEDYARSVHGVSAKKGNEAANCSICHGGAHELLHPKSSEFRAATPDTCGACHSGVVAQYKASVHGQAVARGVAQAPLCSDCHGEHSIQRHTDKASPVSAGRITETCSGCHGNVNLARRFGMPSDRLVSFEASFHGLAAKSGNQTVANCASCHGVHNILPSSDPKSTINAKNLAATCGKCHAGAGQRFAISPVHIIANQVEPTPVFWVRIAYLFLIPAVIGLMLAHNFGDWLRKVSRLRFAGATAPQVLALEGKPEVRMLGFERASHAVLVISFLVLGWTGFALKYPDEWWARPLLLWEGRWPVRSWIHRAAAVAFILVSAAHAISLVVSPRLRKHWMELWPRVSDLREAVENMTYNLGRGSIRPYRSAHSYVEKAEYWAVVWGAMVMALTGLMLWANNLMLALLPKVWLDVATSVHFYEAVLATLAIVVWHFYSVIFDPDVYPMDTAWFSGISARKSAPKPPEKKEPLV